MATLSRVRGLVLDQAWVQVLALPMVRVPLQVASNAFRALFVVGSLLG